MAASTDPRPVMMVCGYAKDLLYWDGRCFVALWKAAEKLVSLKPAMSATWVVERFRFGNNNFARSIRLFLRYR